MKWTRCMAHPELRVPVCIQAQIDDDTAAHAQTEFVELLEGLEIGTGISPMLQGTSPTASSHLRIGSAKPQ
jgi:hypothetical protein